MMTVITILKKKPYVPVLDQVLSPVKHSHPCCVAAAFATQILRSQTQCPPPVLRMTIQGQTVAFCAIMLQQGRGKSRSPDAPQPLILATLACRTVGEELQD